MVEEEEWILFGEDSSGYFRHLSFVSFEITDLLIKIPTTKGTLSLERSKNRVIINRGSMRKIVAWQNLATRAKNKVRRFDRRIVQLAVPTRDRLLQHCDKDHRSHDSNPDFIFTEAESARLFVTWMGVTWKRIGGEPSYFIAAWISTKILFHRSVSQRFQRLHYRKATCYLTECYPIYEIITEETKRTDGIYTNYYIIGVF